jgi:hypothetical protein
VKNRFQSLPFKCNLQRYIEERNIIFGDFLKMGVEMEDRVYEVGRCRSNQVDP